MGRHYEKQFKEDAVQYLLDHPEMDKRQAAEYLNVPYETLYGWYKRRMREERGDTTKAYVPMTEEEKEIARLRRELRDTQDALEVLKKAISILGKN